MSSDSFDFWSVFSTPVMSKADRTLASQSAALVSEVLDCSQLSTAAYPLSAITFVESVQMQLSKVAQLPITCFETFVDYGSLFEHQYNVFAVLLPGGRKTYIKVDEHVVPPTGATSRLVVTLSDNHGTLTARGRLISRIAAPPPQDTAAASLPTLGALVSLLAIAFQHITAHPYDVYRPSTWMSEMLFYALARRYSTHWLATGTLEPDPPLRRFLRNEAGVLDTATACEIPIENAGWLAGQQYYQRMMKSCITNNETVRAHRYKIYDEGVTDWVREWEKAEWVTE